MREAGKRGEIVLAESLNSVRQSEEDLRLVVVEVDIEAGLDIDASET